MAKQVITSLCRTICWTENRAAWDRYVDSHVKGTIFHTSPLLAAYDATEKHQVYATAAVDSQGDIIALLASVRVTTIDGIASNFASRAIYYAEPICDPTPAGQAALQQLLEEHDTSLRRRTLFAEVRNIDFAAEERTSLESAGYTYMDYLNYVLDTRRDADQLMQNISKSTRSSIRRTFKRGVEIVRDESHDGVDKMYRLIELTYQRSKVPLAHAELFHHALDFLPAEQLQIRLAKYEGSDIAAGIGLVYKGRFFGWYGGSERLQGIYPFDCLIWNEIEWCSQNGISYYDFGGAGWPDEEYGPRNFKAKYGGDLLHLGRYRKSYSRVFTAMASSAYNLMRKFK